MKKTLLILSSALICFQAQAEWKNQGEAGAVISAGNTRAETYNAKWKTKYVFLPHVLIFDSNFVQSKQKGTLSSRAWLLGLRYEKIFSEELSIFFAESLEGDSFAGYLQRYNTDAGAKHFFLHEAKDIIWIGELGYRFTREHATNDIFRSYQKARLYTEIIKFWSDTVVSRFWIEYTPNFTDNPAWQLNGSLSLSAAITNMFAFKPDYTVKYNNKPVSAATNKLDRVFTTSLVANF